MNYFSLLIVDDDPFLRESLRLLISKRAPESKLDFAGTGAAALSCMAETGYDMVLLDVHLPDTDGLSLFQHLREQGYRGPIIFASGESDAEIAARAFRLGAADYLVKSEHFFESVFNVIERNLEIDRLRREKAKAEEQREQLIESLQTANEALAEKISALESTQLQLVQSERMAIAGTLAAGVAHEINNPLSFVRGNLKIVETFTRDIASMLPTWYEARPIFERTDDNTLALFYSELMAEAERMQLPLMMERMDRVLRAARDGVDRAARIVGDLVQFSALERPEPQEADLVEEFERAVNLVSGELKHRAKIIRDFEPLPPVVCYPRRLGQVFVNLLVNAAQSIETDGEITVRTRAFENEIHLSVVDTGLGVDPDIAHLLFDPFFTTKDSGAGLGLSVSDAIVRSQGGRILVESEPNVGSTFTIVLPRQRPATNGSVAPSHTRAAIAAARVDELPHAIGAGS